MKSSRIPDVALASFHDGKVDSYYCSTAEDALTQEAVFEAASLSKPVFAMSVLTLVKEHRLDLDRTLFSYMPQPYKHQQQPFDSGPSDVVLDARLKRVTARMVLSHTSGLPNWARGKPLTFQAHPGQQWSYSAEGYIFLQRVVESITGQSLDIFVKETVLRPLGMSHSSFVWEESFSNKLLAGHSATGSIEPATKFVHPLASSTLYTTLPDYELFVAKLLSPTPTSQIAWAEKKQVVVRPNIKLAWGLGLAIETTSPASFFHWGANPGFQSFFLCQPATGRAVLFLTDSDSGLDLVDGLVDRFVKGSHPALQFPMLHPKD